ncbi:MAG: hypothetical protein J6B27_06080 [Alistipes sp.]|nr:hypothetical protein [Alistipes sp.]MBO5235259.1 hypothetical protein [Alistipes sp.]
MAIREFGKFKGFRELRELRKFREFREFREFKERLLADSPLQGGGKDPEGGLPDAAEREQRANLFALCRAARRKRVFYKKILLIVNCFVAVKGK